MFSMCQGLTASTGAAWCGIVTCRQEGVEREQREAPGKLVKHWTEFEIRETHLFWV